MRIIVIFFLLSSLLYGQVSISGTLFGESEEPVVGASVTVTPIDAEDIIAYSISDAKGDYHISLATKLTQVQIHVRSMSYAYASKTLENKTQIIDFQLNKEVIQLKEIVAKASPITRRGDTLNYAVKAFAKEHDRSIADVLKRMPGIEVQNDGRILYEGQPINKYYIEGMDLLEGKYNLANENLPFKEVEKVQVLENHQPIKILDSLVHSDKAALNIKLKNKYAITGQAELGIGAAPLLWEANATPMVFSQKKQLLFSYQTNNTGNNLARQLEVLTLEELLNQTEDFYSKTDWVSVPTDTPPDFDPKRWLKNHEHLASVNYLQKLKKDYEVKLNVSYLNDYQKQKSTVQSVYYTTQGEVLLNEEKYNQLFVNTMDSKLILNKNTKKNYFKNELNFQGFWDGGRGNLVQNNQEIQQEVKNHYFKVSNNFRNIFSVGKQLLHFNSYVSWAKTPQELQVNPGQFQTLLNQGNAYNNLLQKVVQKRLFTKNTIGFSKGIGRFSFTSKTGFLWEKQNLNSSLWVDDEILLETQFSNDMQWWYSKVFTKLETEYKSKHWQMSLGTPFNLYHYNIADDALLAGYKKSLFSIEPNLLINYTPNAFWKIKLKTSMDNEFGTVDQLHYAYILNNYRSIKRINTPLPRTKNKRIGTGIFYKNPIQSLFWTLNYSYSEADKNLMYQTQVNTDASTELLAIEQENQVHRHQLTTRVSKYINPLNANWVLSANMSQNRFEQIINDNNVGVRANIWGVGVKIEQEFSAQLNATYKLNASWLENKFGGEEETRLRQQKQELNINFYPSDNQYLSLQTEWLSTNAYGRKDTYFFSDIIYQYTWKAKKVDFEFRLNNLFNTQHFRNVVLGDYYTVESIFELRPRQFCIKVKFAL